MKYEKPSPKSAENTPDPNFGALNAVGDWVVGATPGALQHFVVHLIGARLAAASFSPADAARTIRLQGFADAFPLTLDGWDGFKSGDDWPYVYCSNSAGEMVKRATARVSEKNGQRYWPDCGVRADPAAVAALLADWYGNTKAWDIELQTTKAELRTATRASNLAAHCYVPRTEKAHGEFCTCEICFAPAHEWALKQMGHAAPKP